MTLSSLQFSFEPADYGKPARHHDMLNNIVTAHINDSFGKMHVGDIRWSDPSGDIMGLYVNPVFRRKGVASALLEQAYSHYDPASGKDNLVKHSPHRTEMGDAWAKAVGGKVPPLEDGKYLDPIVR